MAGKVIILKGRDDSERKNYAQAWLEEDPQTRRVERSTEEAFSLAQYGFTVILNSGRIAKRDIEIVNIDEIDSEVSKEDKK